MIFVEIDKLMRGLVFYNLQFLRMHILFSDIKVF